MRNEEWPSGLLFGTVSGIQVGAGQLPRVRVRLPAYGNMRTWLLPVLYMKTKLDKAFWLPDIGEQVAVFLDEFGEDGIVLGAIYSSADQAPADSADIMMIKFADGTQLSYDRATHHLAITVQGRITINASDKIAITAPAINVTAAVDINGTQHVSGPVRINARLEAGDTHVNGGLTSTGDITADGKLKAKSSALAKAFIQI